MFQGLVFIVRFDCFSHSFAQSMWYQTHIEIINLLNLKKFGSLWRNFASASMTKFNRMCHFIDQMYEFSSRGVILSLLNQLFLFFDYKSGESPDVNEHEFMQNHDRKIIHNSHKLGKSEWMTSFMRSVCISIFYIDLERAPDSVQFFPPLEMVGGTTTEYA